MSANFEFLRPKWRDLATLGFFAEQYVTADPASASVKLRNFSEQIVDFLFGEHGLPKLYRASTNDLLNSHAFQQVIPRVVISKLHQIRITGNQAAHGGQVSLRQAQFLLKEAFDLACWLSMTYAGTAQADLPTYSSPPPPPSPESLQKEKKAVAEKLAAAEAQMQELLAELERSRAHTTRAEQTSAQLQEALSRGQHAANALAFDEASTRRRLIDTMLLAAGWDVDTDGRDTSQVKQEFEVGGQPTPSGRGYVDYVLWDDQSDKPLAVIEAKKTAESPDKGRTQAKLYADALQQRYGQRPLIFYTNGFELSLWNDDPSANEPPRRVFGFYASDSLRSAVFKRHQQQPAAAITVDRTIVDRMYQEEAVKRVVERFSAKHRRSLLVQATGTGKTRVAVALAAALVRANWAKRVLFLCDRKELRKQATNAFKKFLPSEGRTVVSADTAKDRDSRVYLATYPAMGKIFQSFDVGFFDLIIADESHRSIYNYYADIFKYFDALQVGLTATPVNFISRNTYDFFGCEDQDPTSHFSYNDAVSHVPPYLVPFRVFDVTTAFQRGGVKYSQMSAAQRRQLEEDEIEPEKVEYDPHLIDKVVFNKDTNRFILRNLMEHGIRVKNGQQLGKTIVFARNHNHAIVLQTLFDEMYPQYGGKLCRVIDNYDPRAEDLIDDFKGIGTNPDLTIAISVDMLDTGIDVPEVVNLVFAKPVYSYVKFWQMIGRGTRLREDLFGPGTGKTHFLIFDHWKNFEFFDERYTPVEPKDAKPLLQRLFESRITLAEIAVNASNQPAFDIAIKLIEQDVNDLPEGTISVQEKWREVLIAKHEPSLRKFQPALIAALRQNISPLMQWRELGATEAAYLFDLLISRLQTELLRQSSKFDDFKAKLIEEVELLVMHLPQVRAKADPIASVRSNDFWSVVSVESLEILRNELRSVMRYQQEQPTLPRIPQKVVDIKEVVTGVERKEYLPKFEGLELAAYRKRVEEALQSLFETNPTLKRIKAGEPVTDDDLKSLVSLVLTQYPDLDLTDLTDYYPETAGHLDLAIRAIIGLDAEQVDRVFHGFAQKHNLTSSQLRFLQMLQNHIAKYGSIELDRLYDAPFTSLHAEGLDGVFKDDAQINELIGLVRTFAPKVYKETQAR